MKNPTLALSLVLACSLGAPAHIARADDKSEAKPAATEAAKPAAQEGAKPKYGKQVTRLYHSHEYFKRADAPDFWALMPYYTPQLTEGSCSVAALHMVINALRAPRTLGATASSSGSPASATAAT